MSMCVSVVTTTSVLRIVFRGSARKDDAWKLVEYLSEPAQQSRFYHLVGDLPARKSAWADPALFPEEVRNYIRRLRKILVDLAIPVDIVNKPTRGYSLIFRP